MIRTLFHSASAWLAAIWSIFLRRRSRPEATFPTFASSADARTFLRGVDGLLLYVAGRVVYAAVYGDIPVRAVTIGHADGHHDLHFDARYQPLLEADQRLTDGIVLAGAAAQKLLTNEADLGLLFNELETIPIAKIWLPPLRQFHAELCISHGMLFSERDADKIVSVFRVLKRETDGHSEAKEKANIIPFHMYGPVSGLTLKTILLYNLRTLLRL